MKYVIFDWAGNIRFNGERFESFDDAEEYLYEYLTDQYEHLRGEYSILEQDEKG